ncbi:MAG: hypothetical protein J7K26_01155, partial [Candidatus Aenigmarchaeota archaeon]|nr:hypothetical protein [Candidatus Aenigmarchaeota archaeon]
MNKNNLISLITNPIIVIFCLIMIFTLYSPIGTGHLSKLNAFLLSTIFLVGVPSVVGAYYFKKGYIDINISDREKRITVFNIIAIGGILNLIIFYFIQVKILYILTVLYLAETIVLS